MPRNAIKLRKLRRRTREVAIKKKKKVKHISELSSKKEIVRALAIEEGKPTNIKA